MNIAIYPRKSKFSPTSESIANQVAMCREYCDRCFDDPHYLVYDEDEGFSGKSTNRPAYTQMIEDMRAGKFQVLCCYRLDRISRNVRDFAELLDDLQRHNIAFVSVRNNFDTSTPFGRAMVYISSALAQMERETLAERVKDNLYEMARSGRWLGGVTPLGFVAKAQEVHRDDKKRKLLMLSPVEEELAQVRDLFDHFLRLGSVTKLLQYCLEHRIVSRNGNDYSRTTLRLLLTNPVYCTADAEAWAYFSSGDYQLCAQREDFDGVRGIQPFARTRKDDGGTVSLATGLSRPDCTAESFRAPYGCAPSRSFKTTVIWAVPTKPRAPKTRCYRASSAAPAAGHTCGPRPTANLCRTASAASATCA